MSTNRDVMPKFACLERRQSDESAIRTRIKQAVGLEEQVVEEGIDLEKPSGQLVAKTSFQSLALGRSRLIEGWIVIMAVAAVSPAVSASKPQWIW